MAPDPPTTGAGAGATRLRIEIPADWQVGATRGPPLFVTHARLRAPDGGEVEWTSRRHRKGLDVVAAASSEQRSPAGATVDLGDALASSWWMGGLFATGSVLFALGSLPLYFDNVDPGGVAWTFFLGSIFFTTAALLQYREAATAPTSIATDGATAPTRSAISLLGWQPHLVGWWAALVQLVGTVFFNVSTFAATRDDLALQQEQHLIWVPDVLGSIFFLVAGWLAYSEICPDLGQRPDWTVEWWIGALNLAGSVFFGAAAIGARYLTTTGEVANIVLVNLGTFAGALCFLVGAVLLPFESARLSRHR